MTLILRACEPADVPGSPKLPELLELLEPPELLEPSELPEPEHPPNNNEKTKTSNNKLNFFKSYPPFLFYKYLHISMLEHNLLTLQIYLLSASSVYLTRF